jgi:hypothetical protein
MRIRTLGFAAVALCFAAGGLWAQPPREADASIRQWKCDDLPHFQFCYSLQTDDAAVLVGRDDAERSFAHLLKLAGAATYEPRIHLFMVESYTRLQDLTGYYAAGSSRPSEHTVFYVVGHPEALTHELHHEIFTQVWGVSEPWIAEGYAAFAAEPGMVDGQFMQVLESGKAVPLDTMVNSWWDASYYSSKVIYPELGSFVKYLKEKYGEAKLKRAWRGGAKSITEVFGKPLATLETQWQSALRKSEAVRKKKSPDPAAR